jgi:starch synthase
MENQKNVWIFTFEYAGIAKLGGLGEVPANQVKNIADQFNISVIMPSHGQVDRLKGLYEWKKYPFNCVGQINTHEIGLEISERSYHISFYEFQMGTAKVILISGENDFTKRFLDDPTIYNPDTIKGKICFFSLGIRCFVDYFIDNKKKELPKIIHLHDYHVVIPFVNFKQALTKNGLDVASIITIHLLTYPKLELSFFYSCGIDNSPISILLKEGISFLTLKDIFKIAWNNDNIPSVEKVGAIICDVVTTVSQSYLISDIIPNCGKELIDFKSDFLWDGCDWDYYEIYKEVMELHGNDARRVLNLPQEYSLNKDDLKKYLLEYKIGHLNHIPLASSPKVVNTINELSDGNYFIKDGTIVPFESYGPLLITTGRLSPQKGFEIIFQSIPDIISKIPNMKFLFLILPTDYSLDEIKEYASYVKQYPNNLRIIFGVASDIFYLAHLAADVYCALSRWEPFGIMALEAMASKLPVIATKVGGLQETIIDIRNSPKIGTGLLIDKDNPRQFTEALISLVKSAEVAHKAKINDKPIAKDNELLSLINQIPDAAIKSNILLNPAFYEEIRENCYKRVKNNFSWKIVSQKLVELYLKLLNIKEK